MPTSRFLVQMNDLCIIFTLEESMVKNLVYFVHVFSSLIINLGTGNSSPDSLALLGEMTQKLGIKMKLTSPKYYMLDFVLNKHSACYHTILKKKIY